MDELKFKKGDIIVHINWHPSEMFEIKSVENEYSFKTAYYTIVDMTHLYTFSAHFSDVDKNYRLSFISILKKL
jgi:hypothetical protein